MPRARQVHLQLALSEAAQCVQFGCASYNAVIRINANWLATEPLHMRAGADTVLARIVKMFGVARPHHAYLFDNYSGMRMKVLVIKERFTASPVTWTRH